MSFDFVLTGHAASRSAELTFDRRELSLILTVYGRMVAAGKWRDYAIDHRRDRAVFSIFRGSSEHPIYRVEKARGGGGRPPEYSVICMDGRIIGRGTDLAKVLRALDRKLIRLVE
jgi:hypothetical protein